MALIVGSFRLFSSSPCSVAEDTHSLMGGSADALHLGCTFVLGMFLGRWYTWLFLFHSLGVYTR